MARPPSATPADLLDAAALAFLTDLHDHFDTRRLALLAERQNRQATFDAGALTTARRPGSPDQRCSGPGPAPYQNTSSAPLP